MAAAEQLLQAALRDVVKCHKAGALASPSPSDLSTYEEHFAKLPQAPAGTVRVEDAKAYLSTSLLQGNELDAIIAHVCGPAAAALDQSQFQSVIHLIYSTLRAAQDQMFEADTAASPPRNEAAAAAHGKAAKHQPLSRTVSTDGWRIEAKAAPAPPGAAAPAAHARTPAAAGAQAPAVAPAPPDAQPVAVQATAAAPASEAAVGVSEFERRLQSLMAQLQSAEVKEEEAGANGGRLEQLRRLEEQVRALAGDGAATAAPQPQPAAPQPAPAGSPGWQAFSGSPGQATGAAAPPTAPAEAFEDMWASLAGQRSCPESAVPSTPGAAPAPGPVSAEPFVELNPVAAAAVPVARQTSMAGLSSAKKPHRPAPEALLPAQDSAASLPGLGPGAGPPAPAPLTAHSLAPLEALAAPGGTPLDAAALASALQQQASLQAALAAQLAAYAAASGAPALAPLAAAPSAGAQNWPAFPVAAPGSGAEPPRITMDLSKLRSSLRPAGQASARPSHEQDLLTLSDSEGDGSDFESVAAGSVCSKPPARGAPAPPPAAAATPAAPASVASLTGADAAADRGHTKLEVYVRTAEVHYTKPLDRPFFSVSVRDSLGRLVEMPQDTHPGSYSRTTGLITLNATVALATPLAQIPPGSFLLVEIKHWKATDKKFSTLAWSATPLDNLVDFGPAVSRVRSGAVNMHLYKKPVDVSLQKTRRLATRGNDLHITVMGS